MACDCGICKYPAQRNEFCRILKDVADIDVFLLTEESAVSDFGLDSDQLRELSERFGVSVDKDDLVVDVLKAISGC